MQKILTEYINMDSEQKKYFYVKKILLTNQI